MGRKRPVSRHPNIIMCLPKVHHLTSPALPASVASLCTILILLCLPSSTWGEEYCGVILNSDNQLLLNLTEGQTLSQIEFEKIHIQKLFNSRISTGPNCAVQICGFTSYGSTLKDGYIGTTSDYADCKIFENEQVETVPADIFNPLYNVSSIGCGCMRDSNQCTQTCESRMAKLNGSWKKDDCAVLYQENQCNACYLPPVNLTVGKPFKTDNSHSIRTIVVRENCTVKQYIPALKRMARFYDTPQPFIYSGSNNSENNVKSAFQSSPEHFHCQCGDKPIPPPPSPMELFLFFGLGFFSTIGLACLTCCFFLLYKKYRTRLTKNAEETESAAAFVNQN